MKLIYMDNAATTPTAPEVIESMTAVMREHWGNPSSLHKLGVTAEGLVKRSREVIAEALLCAPEEIRFTSGGTESNNLALLGAAARYARRGRHIITTQIEHASVYETARRLEQTGWRVTYLPVDRSGAVRLDALEEALTDDTVLVSLMHVNNETGRIQPVEAVGELLRSRPRTLLHVDAVQAVGKLPLNPRAWGIDLLSCSAHKLHGPKGAGFLYCRAGVELEPLQWGGGQEFGLRSGTENVPGIVGMAKAIRLAEERRAGFAAHTAGLRAQLSSCIRELPELVLHGTEDDAGMAPHIVHFSYPGMRSEVIVHALEERGILVSARSACSSGAEKPSRVLTAMGAPHAAAVSGIRISCSLEQSEADMKRVCEALREVVAEYRPAPHNPAKGRR